MLVDDIQAGCGRTRPFLNFERVTIEAKMVCLSKLISGYGLQLSALMVEPDFNIWTPVGFQNLVTCADQQFHAARSYSLIKPPRTGRHLIRL
jgi:4-aminobutyrate aminotransferase-like enzyme